MKKVSVNIGEILEKENLSLRSLADKCGIRHAALSELINGKRQNINFGHIERIANTFNIEDINEILSLVEVEEENDV
ncbi:MULTISPECIES: helix-turn-helix domain-containing protein [Bacillus]|uniref:helix-turn-helix domain-containing protein n=1 Tax=Bacillus TaxID=1386 RepID=UPI000654566D|nr:MULTISPECIES: helix-turn-helix transcriptional regulator [Bacillus]MDH3117226.1 helix-turn-helix transcriptional regulator [Bacillus subtilis]KRT89849.1 Cro/Cl family transcriptional regulator [Bacillus paralicheniformis]MCY7800873.1 helix-turn-helix transcriptional regulator [Bacillus haynesii]MEC0313936.1 helix-turn-helix transcriptional regulator [Bacillus subtilis]MEC0360844.1 helix-turn-helix transcriptional regulator [Bacillus subtilis]